MQQRTLRFLIRCVLVITLFFLSAAASAQWVRKADALKLRSEVGETIVYNDKLYAFVGFSDTDRHAEPSSEVYNPATDSWAYIASMPANAAMTHQDIILVDNTVWHIGGRVGQNPGPLSSAIWIYNITSNSWSRGPEIRDPATGNPLVIAASASALLGRVLHIFAGFTPNACTNDQDKYHLTLDVDTWLANPTAPAKWENKLKPLPMKRNHLSAVTLGGKIYAIGGQTDHDCTTLGKDGPYCHVYNPTTDSWTQLTSLPTGRSHAEGSTFAIDGKIYIVGGQGSDGKSSRYVTIFDPAANNGAGSWTENSSLTLPYIYEGCSATVIGNTFILSHGSQGTSKYPLKMTYTRTISRNPVYKLGFPSECLHLVDSEQNTVKGNTWLFTIDGTKNYTTSSNAGWLTVSKNATGTANSSAVDIEVTANTEGLPAGNYSATITATGTGGGTSYTAATLCVTLTVKTATSPGFNVTLTTNGNGNITKNPDQTSYAAGDNVILTATPAAGQQFAGWSGSASGTSNPLTVTMNGDKAITANFQSQTLITGLSVTSKKSYLIAELKTGIAHYTDRTYKVTSVPAMINLAPFIRTPNDDRSSKATSIIEFNVSQRAIIYVAYDPRATKLPSWLSGWQKSTSTLGITDGAITYLNLYSKIYPAGKVTLGGNMVSPAAGAQSNYLVIAVAQPLQYNLNTSSNGNGTVTRNPDQSSYNAGTTLSLTATPANGHQFTGWSGSATGTASPLSITMNATKDIIANFSASFYELNVAISGDGTVNKSPDQATYENGSTVTLTAIPSAGQQFTGWSGNVTGNTNPLTITMNAAKNITANFSAEEYSLTLTSSGNGSVSKSPDQATFASGSTVTLTASPEENYHFTEWSGDEAGTGNPLTVIMGANKTIMATFEAVAQGRAGKSSSVNDNKDIAGRGETNGISSSLKIYPNPFYGASLTIELANLVKQQTVNIAISDIFGRVYQTVKALTDKSGLLNKTINFIPAIHPGIYMLNISSPHYNKVVKVIVN